MFDDVARRYDLNYQMGLGREGFDAARGAITSDYRYSEANHRGFYRRWGWKHPSIADPRGEIASRLGLTGTPTTFFLDREHRVVSPIVGASNLRGFDLGLRAASNRS